MKAERRADPEAAIILFSGERTPFLSHLEEIRRRLLRGLLWLGIGTLIAWRFSPQILARLVEPVGQVVYLSPLEPFLVRLTAAFLGGLGLSFPLLAWEAWGFVRPALRPAERWLASTLIPASVLLFFVGAGFGWKLLLPAALTILEGFGTEFMMPMITLGAYLNFAGWLIVGCGLIFQMPLVILFLIRAGIVRPWTLLRGWRVAAVALLVTAAVITPTPDIFTQLLLAAPLAGLYLISVILGFLAGER